MSYTLDEFWRAFGEKRFTKAELWRVFGHRAFPGFPTPEWLTSLGVGRVLWLEVSPGPRGGEGFRISASAASAMKAKYAKKTERDSRLQTVCEGVKLPFGRMYVDGGKLKWAYYPGDQLGIRLGDGIAMAWSDGVRHGKVQQDVNWKADHVAKLAGESISRKREEIEQLEALLHAIANTTATST